MRASFLPSELLSDGGGILDVLSSFSSGGGGGDDGASSPALSPLVEEARGKFWFYFLAGSGAGGIGAAQLPSVFRDANEARAAASASSAAAAAASATTRGGGGRRGRGGTSSTTTTTTTLDAGPFVKFYYDANVRVESLIDAVEKAPKSSYIRDNSRSKNYMSTKGYIERSDYVRVMNEKGCDALASYALFDAISAGKGGVISPIVYDERLETYAGMIRDGTFARSFATDLNGFLGVKLGAFVGLVFCLLVDFGFVAKNGIQGFLS